MINAKEAKLLYDSSSAMVESYLTRSIEPAIKNAAQEGELKVVIHIDSLESSTYLNQVVTQLHKSTVERLLDLGYTAKIGYYGDTYIPRGLINDDGDGPTYQRYGLIIGW